jgi:hypothetical protein
MSAFALFHLAGSRRPTPTWQTETRVTVWRVTIQPVAQSRLAKRRGAASSRPPDRMAWPAGQPPLDLLASVDTSRHRAKRTNTIAIMANGMVQVRWTPPSTRTLVPMM